MSSKTKDAIVSAYLELIEREEFDRITVTDLVEMCDISRQTFYYHFDDIDQMLRYAFDAETRQICSHTQADNWTDYSEGYISFFTKYDTLMRKALYSQSFVLVYNLISASFTKCLYLYFERKKGEAFAAARTTEFLVVLLSGAFTSLVVSEIQKESSNYREIFTRLDTALLGYTL